MISRREVSANNVLSSDLSGICTFSEFSCGFAAQKGDRRGVPALCESTAGSPCEVAALPILFLVGPPTS